MNKYTEGQKQTMYWLYKIEFHKNLSPLCLEDTPACYEEWLDNEFAEGIFPKGWEEVFKNKEQVRTVDVKYMEKEFVSGNTCISRQDYFDLPVPMDSQYFSDELMQLIANEIDETISSIYGKDYDIFHNESVVDLYWELMESVALEHGMDYFEDYPFEVEFKNKGE